jgi:hypothetical protein
LASRSPSRAQQVLHLLFVEQVDAHPVRLEEHRLGRQFVGADPLRRAARRDLEQAGHLAAAACCGPDLEGDLVAGFLVLRQEDGGEPPRPRKRVIR